MKVLVTSGCSFSECVSPWANWWPKHLSRHLSDYSHVSKAMGSQGNGLISRGIIYQVTEELKTKESDDILVGIMWSGPDRHDFFVSNATVKQSSQGVNNENPTKFIKDGQGAWTILNKGPARPDATYYSDFHDRVGQYIYTCEHILRTQWFLNLHGIKYFMTTYTSEVLPEIIKTHPDTEHLYNQIDMDHFLPVDGEYEWCRDFSGLAFPAQGDRHPGAEQHKKFTDDVIIPFLKEKNYI